jgi:hypothetical protein
MQKARLVNETTTENSHLGGAQTATGSPRSLG